MIHDGNKIFGDEESEESIKLIKRFLLSHHIDGDDDSLFCRFGKLLMRMEEQEISSRATWNSYIRVLGENKELKKPS